MPADIVKTQSHTLIGPESGSGCNAGHLVCKNYGNIPKVNKGGWLFDFLKHQLLIYVITAVKKI